MKTVSGNLKTKKTKANLINTDRSTHATEIGLKKKKRTCLKCGDKFLSKGPYNRICDKCSLSNERVASSAYSVGKNPPSGPNSFEKQLYELN